MKKLTLLIITLCISLLSYTQIPKFSKQSKIINHTYYWVNFNDSAREPNYVFYKLYKTNLKKPKLPRKSLFKVDPLCPNSMNPDEYAGYDNMYDRGHLFNYDNNAWDKTTAKECFYMTNIAVQISNFNRDYGRNLKTTKENWQ
jgi:DNA/RNA endonuclease G (NUC1)